MKNRRSETRDMPPFREALAAKNPVSSKAKPNQIRGTAEIPACIGHEIKKRNK